MKPMVSVRGHKIAEYLLSNEAVRSAFVRVLGGLHPLPIHLSLLRSVTTQGTTTLRTMSRGMETDSTLHANTMRPEMTTSSSSSACPFHQIFTKEKPTTTSPGVPKPTPQCPARRNHAKAFSQLPAPKGIPIFGTTLHLMLSGGAPHIHEYCDRRHKQLGPIYRERLGAVEAVFVADSQLIQQVYLNDDRHPKHLVPEPWLIYNKIKGIKRGLFFMEGPEWKQRRTSLNNILLKKKVNNYSLVFNDVITDLLNRWSEVQNSQGLLVDLEKELYSWSIESLGAMLFGKRLGCVSSNMSLANIHEFVECVQQIFTESAIMTTIPPQLACTLNLPVWRRFTKAAGTALELARGYVEDNVRSAKASDPSSSNGVLSEFLREDQISTDEIIRIVVDLFLAAADTTSHATQWALHLLAKHPECQDRLLEEVRSVVPKGEIVNNDHLNKLSYTRALIKEALRLYPVAPFLTRILSKDLTLGGYNIPAGTLILMSVFTTGRDPKYYEDPLRFNPDRWIRERGVRDTSSAFACLPFGFGVRSCIGRRVAESQMEFLLIRAVEKFRLESMNENEVGIRMRMITTPSEKIKLRLTMRHT